LSFLSKIDQKKCDFLTITSFNHLCKSIFLFRHNIGGQIVTHRDNMARPGDFSPPQKKFGTAFARGMSEIKNTQ
jgi:hypothetical protein